VGKNILVGYGLADTIPSFVTLNPPGSISSPWIMVK
jgi:hypothetical protein